MFWVGSGLFTCHDCVIVLISWYVVIVFCYLVNVFIVNGNAVDLSVQDRVKINYMLSERVGPATLASYNRHGLPEWIRFLREDRKWFTSLDSDTLVGLQSPEHTDELRVQLFILYVYHLRQCGVNDVSVYFKALGHDFILKGWLALAELLKSPLVMVARKHGERRLAREKAAAKNEYEKEAICWIFIL